MLLPPNCRVLCITEYILPMQGLATAVVAQSFSAVSWLIRSTARPLLFASAGAALLAGWHASSFTSYGPALRAYWIVFGLAAVAFVCAGVVLHRGARGGPLLAACGAVVLAGWAVTTGYGPV